MLPARHETIGERSSGTAALAFKKEKNSSESLRQVPASQKRLVQEQPRPEPVKEPIRKAFQFSASGPRVEEWVRQVQGFRGSLFSKEEREEAVDFLTGKVSPKGMGRGAMQWLADEVLTALRLQEPPWEGLAAALGEAAFQPTTDPVVRDYIMQHLGHLWEQAGSRAEIDQALWRGVAASDETTPGSSLIALNYGYQRDQNAKGQEKVSQQAMALARNPNVSLAVRTTALSIATEGKTKESQQLAETLEANPETPFILRRVAEHALKNK